jgi:hypothetical protein
MLGPERPGAVLPDRALYLPTFSHFLIVNKTSRTLSLSRALSLSISLALARSLARSSPFMYCTYCDSRLPETGEKASFSSGLSDAPRLSHRRPGSSYDMVEILVGS